MRPAEAPLSFPDVADRLNVSVSTVKRLVYSGQLPHLKIGRRVVRVHPADLERFIEECRSLKAAS